jgi:hypothetical protein
MRGLDSGSCDRSSLLRPNRDSAVGTAILAGSFEGKAHMLTGMKHPVAGCFDVGEVDETAARHLRRIDYAPAFVRVELLDHSRYSAWLNRGLPRHGLIVPCAQTALICCTPATAGIGHFQPYPIRRENQAADGSRERQRALADAVGEAARAELAKSKRKTAEPKGTRRARNRRPGAESGK